MHLKRYHSFDKDEHLLMCFVQKNGLHAHGGSSASTSPVTVERDQRRTAGESGSTQR